MTKRPDVDISPYRDADFAGVDALWTQAFPDDPPSNRAAIAIPAKQAFQSDLLFVATEGSDIVGSVMAGYDGHRGWLYAVAVRQDSLGRGIGTALVRHAERTLGALGCTKVNLQVRSSNAGVVRFYERLGYAVEDRVSLGRHL